MLRHFAFWVAIGIALGVGFAINSHAFSESPGQTGAGQIAYVVGLMTPTTVICIIIAFVTRPKKAEPTKVEKIFD